jgi:hypothetical protein
VAKTNKMTDRWNMSQNLFTKFALCNVKLFSLIARKICGRHSVAGEGVVWGLWQQES